MFGQIRADIAFYGPAVVGPEDEGRAQCLGYNSRPYVNIGIVSYLLHGFSRSCRNTKVTAVITHLERSPLHSSILDIHNVAI